MLFLRLKRERKIRNNIITGLTFHMQWSLVNLTCFSKNAGIEKQKVDEIVKVYSKNRGYECVNFKSSDIKFWDEIYTIVENCVKEYTEIALIKNEEKSGVSILDKYNYCCLIVKKIPIENILQIKELVEKSAYDYFISHENEYSKLDERYIVRKLLDLSKRIFSEPYLLQIATGVTISNTLRVITNNNGIFFFP